MGQHARIIPWTLDNALGVIRKIQPKCMELGFYVALAGGVLNNGQSSNDLDLVVVPRTYDVDPTPFICYIESEFGAVSGIVGMPGGRWMCFPDSKVELLLVRI